MAESDLEFFLKCPVCLDILTEPVSLSCHHSFCKRCLTEHWAQQPSRPCPVCRRRSSKDNLDVNFVLRELSISFREKLQRSASTQDLRFRRLMSDSTQDLPSLQQRSVSTQDLRSKRWASTFIQAIRPRRRTNTAAPKLCLSEELSSVRFTETLNKDLPDVLERFSYYAIVLGSVGYSSGTHQWDVEVGDHPHWTLGVVKEMVDRKKTCRVSPENGFFCFVHYKGQYYNGNEHMKVENPPEKIRVKLDYNTGKLSFSDADHMTLLCTHTVPKGTSAEKLFPLFYVRPEGDAKTKELRICEVQSEDNRSMELPMPF